MGKKKMDSLEEHYQDDPTLLEFYKKRLIEPGFGGELDNIEYEYVRDKLKRSNRLRTRWKFTKGSRRLSKAKIIHTALYGIEG